MKDMLVCKNLWLSVQYGKTKSDKIDVATWEVMHLKATTYMRCFINTSLYDNFNEENKVDVF